MKSIKYLSLVLAVLGLSFTGLVVQAHWMT